MTVDAIAALPVGPLADDDAHLFMWTLDRFVLDGSATQVARAWGFEPLPFFIVWRKANAGLGRYVRPAHELILVARRGSARLNEAALTSVRDWKQPYLGGAKQHSAKPDAALDEIAALSDGPYLELFARRQRLGWDTWGNEALGHVEIAS
jgi:N6-adenosine-specific RNA methylase IME4